MLNVSENAAAVINGDGRTFKARITVDGQIITDSIKRILFTYGTCGASAFAFGSVFKSYAEITISELDFSIADKEMLIEIGPVLPDESVEYISMGYFKAPKQNIKIEKNKIEIKAYDRLENSGTYVPTVEFPTSIQSVIDDISNQMGVQIITEFDTSYMINKTIESGTYTSVLQVIAGLLGGIVVCDRFGRIVITEHPRTANAQVDEERCLKPIESSSDKYRIDTLTVIASAGGTDALGEEEAEISYTYGSGSGISVENEYMTEEIFNAMKNRVVGYSFNPCSLKFMGDPRIESTDALEVTNWAGEVFFVPCMSLVHEFDGGFSTEISTPSIATGESGTIGPLQQTVNNLVHDMVLAKKVIAKQITAERIDVDGLFAKDITATGTITGARLIGATGSFDGEITASSGEIGGFNIGTKAIYKGTDSLKSKENGVYVGIDGIKTAGSDGCVIHAGYYSQYFDNKDKECVGIGANGIFCNTYDDGETIRYSGITFQCNNKRKGYIDDNGIWDSLGEYAFVSWDGSMEPKSIRTREYITCGTRIYLPNGNALRGMNNGYDISEVSTSNSSVIGYISTLNRAILGSADNAEPTEVRSSGALYLKCAGTTADDDNRYALTFLRVNFGSSDSPVYYGCVRSRLDNYTVLGSSNFRFRNVFSTNGVSTTSDRNKKHNIKELDDKYIQLFDELRPVSYVLNDGGERTHVGFISQDVEDAMNKIGMSPMDFAGFCKDIIADDEGNPILDKNGNVQYYYSLRYGEFTPVNTAKIQQVENKMDNQFEKDEEWKKQIEEKIEKILEHLQI